MLLRRIGKMMWLCPRNSTKAFWLEHLWILNLCKLIRPFSPLSSTETDFFWEVTDCQIRVDRIRSQSRILLPYNSLAVLAR